MMTQTLDNIEVITGVWLNIYEVAGIAIGQKIRVQNVGQTTIYLNAGVDQPTDQSAFIISDRGTQYSNETGDMGAWCYSTGADGIINVQVAF